MPSALVESVTVLALVAMLVVAFAHPSARVELATGLAAAGSVLAVGAVPWSDGLAEVDALLPVVAFLAAILLVAEACAAEGVFSAVGALVARAGRGSPRRILALTFVAAALTTAALSLDATVVLLTPVVAAAAAGARVSARPVVHACARLANSASLLLPVSNLTNLLAMPRLHLSFTGFAAAMAPVWLAAVAVEYVGHRLFFRLDLAGRSQPQPPPVSRQPLPAFPLAVLALMLAGFAVASPLGVQPAWVAAAAAVVLGGHAVRRRRFGLAQALHAAHAPFAVFVLCLGVVVAAVAHGFLADAVAAVLPHDGSLAGLLGVAGVAMLLANLVNNLPATLLLLPLLAPLGVPALLAALVGLGAGSNLTYVGSLANLLWRRTLVRHAQPPSAVTFHRLSALLTLPTVAVSVVVLWAWAPVVGLAH